MTTRSPCHWRGRSVCYFRSECCHISIQVCSEWIPLWEVTLLAVKQSSETAQFFTLNLGWTQTLQMPGTKKQSNPVQSQCLAWLLVLDWSLGALFCMEACMAMSLNQGLAVWSKHRHANDQTLLELLCSEMWQNRFTLRLPRRSLLEKLV